MTAPFGIEFYSQSDHLKILHDLGEGKFFVSPPKPHPVFDRYLVQTTPNLGVTWIKAISPTLSNDAYGSAVRQAMHNLNIQLSKRYGTGRTSDFLMTGSIWNEERDWTHGLSANERFYFIIWERPSAELPEDIQSVFLGANGFGDDETAFSIEYSSTKSDEAELEIQGRLANLL